MKPNIDTLIHSPSDSVSAAIKYLEVARENMRLGLGLRFPIAKIANELPVPPIMPGKVATFQGKSHNGKSMFLDFWKNTLAENLAKKYRKEDIIIAVLFEDMVEEAMIGELLRQAERLNMRAKLDSMETVKIAAAEIEATPIYYIGASIERAGDGQAVPTMTNVERAIFRIIEQRKDKGLKTTIQGIFADYIQAAPLDGEVLGGMPDKTRRLQVRADFFGLRRLAAKLPAPCVMASQSKQKLEGNQPLTMQTPYLYDHQETSAIPQHTDADFSIWMPKNDLEYGSIVTHEGERDIVYKVTDNLAWLRVNKQRGFDPMTLQRLPGGWKYPLKINFELGSFELIERKDINL